MSIAKEIYDVGKDIRAARKEYKKTHAKDEYIKIMEDQLDSLLVIVDELKAKIDEYEAKDVFTLNDHHKALLKMIKASPDFQIEGSVLLRNASDETRIAFEELLANDYIHNVNAMVGHLGYAPVYSFYSEKKVEILKLLLK